MHTASHRCTPTKLRRWRKGRGWSIRAAARHFEISEGAWRHWEAGRRAIPWGLATIVLTRRSA